MQLADALTTAYLNDDGALGGPRRTWLLAASAVIAAALVVATFVVWPKPVAGITALAFVMLVACATTDLASFRIPNLLTYSGTALVLIAAATTGGASFTAAALGALVGFAIIGGLSVFSRGKVGFGDAKLSAFGGALVGADFTVQALFVGTLAAAVLCIVLLAGRSISGSQPLPYAPFLSLGFIVTSLATGTSLGL